MTEPATDTDEHHHQTASPDRAGRIGPLAGLPRRRAGPIFLSEAIRLLEADEGRRRWRRVATVTGSLVILSFAGQSNTGATRAAAATLEGTEAGDRDADRGVPAADAATVQDLLVAVIDGVELVNPAPTATLVGFHEAAGPGPLALTPAYVIEDLNPERPKPRPAGDLSGDADVGIVVLPSRGRPAEATTAIDVGVPEGHPILSPVTGTVLSVERYVLYGQHEDHIIRIAPDARHDLAVKLVHVRDPAVAAGQRVEAGRTRLAASARLFPFSSQIDRFADARGVGIGPHVHLEVEPVAG